MGKSTNKEARIKKNVIKNFEIFCDFIIVQSPFDELNEVEARLLQPQ